MATNPREVGKFTLTIAEEVRRRRLGRRWKQDQLSAASGITQGTLSRIERGLAPIDMEQLEDVAHAFDTSPEEFISSARENYGSPVEPDDVYLPDGTLNPAIGSPTRMSAEHAKRLRSRSSEEPTER